MITRKCFHVAGSFLRLGSSLKQGFRGNAWILNQIRFAFVGTSPLHCRTKSLNYSCSPINQSDHKCSKSYGIRLGHDYLSCWPGTCAVKCPPVSAVHELLYLSLTHSSTTLPWLLPGVYEVLCSTFGNNNQIKLLFRLVLQFFVRWTGSWTAVEWMCNSPWSIHSILDAV